MFSSMCMTRTVVDLLLVGEIDHANAPELRRLMVGLRDLGRDVNVDLGSLTFCDAGCLRVLQEVAAWQTASGRTLRLSSPTDHVRRLLTIAALDHLVGPSLAPTGR